LFLSENRFCFFPTKGVSVFFVSYTFVRCLVYFCFFSALIPFPVLMDKKAVYRHRALMVMQYMDTPHHRLACVLADGSGVITMPGVIPRDKAITFMNHVILRDRTSYWVVDNSGAMGMGAVVAINGTALKTCIVDTFDSTIIRMHLQKPCASGDKSYVMVRLNSVSVDMVTNWMQAACEAAQLAAADCRRLVQYAPLAVGYDHIPMLIGPTDTGTNPFYPMPLATAVGFAPGEAPQTDTDYDVVVVHGGGVARYQRGLQAELRPVLRLDDNTPPASLIRAQLHLDDTTCWFELTRPEADIWKAINLRRLISFESPLPGSQSTIWIFSFLGGGTYWYRAPPFTNVAAEEDNLKKAQAKAHQAAAMDNDLDAEARTFIAEVV
jgi:hypothetical protein